MPKKKRPAFVRLEIQADEAPENGLADKDGCKPVPIGYNHLVIAAELTAPGGCQVRIFNGADCPTLSALIQALANSCSRADVSTAIDREGGRRCNLHPGPDE